MPLRPLRVVVAPDSFGGALDSVGVAAAIVNGWQRARGEDELMHAPMADGGEGTLAALADALGDRAERRTAHVHDPLGREVEAEWLVLDEGRSAFVEMAAASGLARLAPNERTPANARLASTRGTGELLREALDAGVETITIGLGGSATTDGGAGLLAALGLRLLDGDGNGLPDGGGSLGRLARADPADLDSRLRDVRLTIACVGRPRGFAAEASEEYLARIARYAPIQLLPVRAERDADRDPPVARRRRCRRRDDRGPAGIHVCGDPAGCRGRR